jgi:membrane protein
LSSKENTFPNGHSKTDWKERLHKKVKRTRTLIDKDIWELKYLGRRTPQARFYLFMRILVLTIQGLQRNKLAVQSAALTFYSLIGIGPLIALGIMISGFVLDQSPVNSTNSDHPAENRAVEVITKAIAYAAPQLGISADGNVDSTNLAPEITEMVNNFIEAAQSGTVGIIGSLMLFAIAMQVLSSIEGSFNSLWGVDKGRKLGERIFVYWTFISMGAVIGAASLTLITIPKIIQVMERLPFGGEFLSVILFFSPIIAGILIILLLTGFFCFIPNTKVEWKAALTGATLVVVSLHIYNMLSFLYVERVVDTRSLYGSVGIIVILMLGLYVFWSLILLGGQVTYAVQNADFLTNENAWQKTSEQTQEIISLGVLIVSAKRFQSGTSPVSFSDLLQKLRVPSHVLNSSLHRLCELGYLASVKTDSIEDERDHAYQLSRSPESISLSSFKQSFQAYGNNDGTEMMVESIPELSIFIDEIISLKDCSNAKLTIGELILNSTVKS